MVGTAGGKVIKRPGAVVEFLQGLLAVGGLALWIRGVLWLADNQVGKSLEAFAGAGILFIVVFLSTRHTVRLRRIPK